MALLCQATMYTARHLGTLQLMPRYAAGKGLPYLCLSRCYGWHCLGSRQQGEGWVGCSCNTGRCWRILNSIIIVFLDTGLWVFCGYQEQSARVQALWFVKLAEPAQDLQRVL